MLDYLNKHDLEELMPSGEEIKSLLPTKQSLKERFLTFETLKGLYLAPTGIIILLMAYFYIKPLLDTATTLPYLLQIFFMLSGAFVTVEGLRKIFVNRITQKAKISAMVSTHITPTVAIRAPKPVIRTVLKASPKANVVKRKVRKSAAKKPVKKKAKR